MSITSDGGHFRLDTGGAIATITLDRSEKRNALTPASLRQLEEMAESLGDMPEVRAVIVRAEGGDFSVGADISGMGGTPEPTVQLRRTATQGARLMRALGEIHQPVICAVQGIATGGATCIATACDFRIAADDARMGYGEVKLGINLMWNALPLAVRLVGPSRAKQLVMSGDLFPAATLERWGFVDEIVPRAELEASARAMAERYAALPPIAVQMIKRSVNALSGAMDAAIMHADADQWLLGTRTEDFVEAITAFREKRSGSFSGR